MTTRTTIKRPKPAPVKCRSTHCQGIGDPKPMRGFRDMEGYCGMCRDSITDTSGT